MSPQTPPVSRSPTRASRDDSEASSKTRIRNSKFVKLPTDNSTCQPFPAAMLTGEGSWSAALKTAALR